MKKVVTLMLTLALSASLIGCSSKAGNEAGAEVLTGKAEGFGGEIIATVTKEGDKITKVEVVGEGETAGIGTNAIDALPGIIVEANSTDVEAVAGATITSKAIINAVNNALDPEKYPYPAVAEEPVAEEPKVEAPKGEAGAIAKIGIGQNISIAKSSDATADKTATAQADVTIAAVGFDADGKVASVTLDVSQAKVAFDKDMKVT